MATFSMVAEPCKSLGMENKLPSIHEHRVGALAWTKVFSLGFILENSITIWIFNRELDPGGIKSLYTLSICTWFLKNQVWKIKFDELDF